MTTHRTAPPRARRARATLALALLVASQPACGGMLDVTNPSSVQEDDLANPADQLGVREQPRPVCELGEDFGGAGGFERHPATVGNRAPATHPDFCSPARRDSDHIRGAGGRSDPVSSARMVATTRGTDDN